MHSKFRTICKLIESGQLDDAEAVWDTCIQDDDANNNNDFSLSSDTYDEE